MFERVRIRGHVRIWESRFVEHYLRGRPYWGSMRLVVDKPNLVVDAGQRLFLRALMSNEAQNVIDHVQFGTGGGEVPEPDVEMTALVDEDPVTVEDPDVDYEDAPTNRRLRFRFLLDRADGNGEGSVSYRECGLFTNGGVLVCYESFEPILKDATRRYHLDWTLFT